MLNRQLFRLLRRPADAIRVINGIGRIAIGSGGAPAGICATTTVAATALTEEGAPDVEEEPDPGLMKRPRDLDLPAWLKGRYGTAVGRAVARVWYTRSKWVANRLRSLPRKARAPWARP